ncbi:MAG: GNAT family N-acetyltransferase [Acidimicrobiia bacterium]|nr:GNAT family N-acetyltransferase [Acidimicrobiia bacterium]
MADDRRRQGIGAVLVVDLLADTAELGANRAYLQVEETNKPTLAMYCAMGFEAGYRYW